MCIYGWHVTPLSSCTYNNKLLMVYGRMRYDALYLCRRLALDRLLNLLSVFIITGLAVPATSSSWSLTNDYLFLIKLA